MKKIVVCGLLLMSAVAHSAVWNSDKEWNDSWQERYSKWVATSVGPNFFKDLGGPFKRLKLDCADAHYALMAYFSREHGLHMAVNNRKTTNQTSRFDNINGSDEKLAAFIRFLAGSYGTESLVHSDTYPVALDDVKPGDLFMYKVGSNGNFTRHAYIIKNINMDGTFDIIYSTQARRDAGKPLNRQKSYMFKKAPFNTGVDKNHWGFRRAKRSDEAHISQENLPQSDFSQYVLAFRLLNEQGFTNGKLAFFREVRRLNKSIDESPNRVAQRNFDGTCKSVQDRVDVVQNGVDHNNKLGGRCMNFADYDAYSTPSRDSGIMDDYRNYFSDIQAAGGHNALNDYNRKIFTIVFKNGDLTPSEKTSVLSSCPVETSVGLYDVASFKQSLFAGHVSYHPNDNIYRRWGELKGAKSRCEEYYGYPTD